jgi:type I restriction enzyme S subunit
MYLAYTLRSKRFQDEMVRDAGGTAIKHIYITRISKMRVPVPAIEEQMRICRELEHIESTLEGKQEILARSILLLGEYRTALISAAVTGQIDVRTYRKEPEAAMEAP